MGADANGEYNGRANKDYGRERAQDPSALKSRVLKKRKKIERAYWAFACPCETSAHVDPAVVLDPFCGAGTTGVAARRMNAKFIGIDSNREYLCEEALPRLLEID